MSVFDATIKAPLNDKLEKLEKRFDADVVFFYGEIHAGLIRPFRDMIEDLKKNGPARGNLVIVLNTPGGSAETAEKLVDIIRFHYPDVAFVVPDIAMSAGTIFCMSGDRIYMDYSSSLGPIDPQVWNEQQWVPALGYLDKVEEMLAKALNRRGIRRGPIAIRQFYPNASDDQLARMQDEMLAELRLRHPAVWAAYSGTPGKGEEHKKEAVGKTKSIMRQRR